MGLHGGLSHAEPGLCCSLPLGSPFPPSALGWHRSVGDSVSQFRLPIQLKMSWFSSYPNTGRAETQDRSPLYSFLANELGEGHSLQVIPE